MINFFRRIRKKLADDNKPLKYLRYAIGEIVLVVVGILIALQINNWNEDRKANIQEVKILEEMKDVLEGELEHQSFMISGNKNSKASAKLIIDYFNSGLPYHDSINHHFVEAHSRYVGLIRDNAYQKAKSYGLGFIATDSLMELLTWTYEVNTNWLGELNERNNLYENVTVIPRLTELFESVIMTDINRLLEINPENDMIPLDYQELVDDKQYRTILKTTIHKREEYLWFQERRYMRMLKLLELLDLEIQLRKSRFNL